MPKRKTIGNSNHQHMKDKARTRIKTNKQRFKQLPVHVKKKVRLVTGLLGSVNVDVDVSKTTNSCYLTVCGLFVVRVSDHSKVHGRCSSKKNATPLKTAISYETKKVLTRDQLVNDLLVAVERA